MHPTSVVHALVRFRDGATLAHLGYPDMRVPISFALTHPERRATPVPALDFSAGLQLAVRAARSRAIPAPRAGARGGRARRHVSVRVQRGERGRRGGVPRRPDRVPRHLDARRGRTRRVRRCACRRPRGADRGRHAGQTPRAGKIGDGMSLLHRDPRPRLPHPRARGRALLRIAGRRPPSAPVLRRLSAPDREDDRQGHRVRDRGDPARRLRDDPGHAPADPARCRAPVLARRGGRAGPRRLGGPREAVAGRRRPDLGEARRRRLRRGAAGAEGLAGGPRLGPEGDHRAARRARLGCVLEGADVEAARRDRRGPGGQHRARRSSSSRSSS